MQQIFCFFPSFLFSSSSLSHFFLFAHTWFFSLSHFFFFPKYTFPSLMPCVFLYSPLHRFVPGEAHEVRGPCFGASPRARPGTGRKRQTAHLWKVRLPHKPGGEKGNSSRQRSDRRHRGHSGLSDPLGKHLLHAGTQEHAAAIIL